MSTTYLENAPNTSATVTFRLAKHGLGETSLLDIGRH